MRAYFKGDKDAFVFEPISKNRGGKKMKLKDLKPGARKQISKQDILEALQCHGSPHHVCEDCPYQEYDGCSAQLARDTLELIERMEYGTREHEEIL